MEKLNYRTIFWGPEKLEKEIKEQSVFYADLLKTVKK
jgi:hypothetical protein